MYIIKFKISKFQKSVSLQTSNSIHNTNIINYVKYSKLTIFKMNINKPTTKSVKGSNNL